MGSAHPVIEGGELQFCELKKIVLEVQRKVLRRCKRIWGAECYLVEGALLQECLDLDRDSPTLLKKKKKKQYQELCCYEKLTC